MRPLINIAIAAMIFTACSSGGGNESLDQLIVKRDSLKELRTEINASLMEVETQISALDTQQSAQLTKVTVMEAQHSRFEHYFTVQGVVETDQNAQIFPEAAGKVLSIPVKEGDRVSKGQLMMQLDNSIVSNQIQEVKARLGLAETVFKKQEALWNQNIGSEIQYLEAKNNYESLKQNLETLMSQRDLYAITAPFSGVVDEISLKVGEMAAPQMPAFRLINTDEMYIKADVTERYLSVIKEGDLVEVNFPGVGVKQASKVGRIGQYINPNNRTFKIRLKLNNEGNKLKPNLLGELKIRDYVNDSTIVVPTSLIQMTPSGEEFVYTLENNQARKVMVTTGQSYNDRVEVLSGLQPGAVLINKGARSIKEGENVIVEE